MKDEGWIKANWQADTATISLISIQGAKTHLRIWIEPLDIKWYVLNPFITVESEKLDMHI